MVYDAGQFVLVGLGGALEGVWGGLERVREGVGVGMDVDVELWEGEGRSGSYDGMR